MSGGAQFAYLCMGVDASAAKVIKQGEEDAATIAVSQVRFNIGCAIKENIWDYLMKTQAKSCLNRCVELQLLAIQGEQQKQAAAQASAAAAAAEAGEGAPETSEPSAELVKAQEDYNTLMKLSEILQNPISEEYEVGLTKVGDLNRIEIGPEMGLEHQEFYTIAAFSKIDPPEAPIPFVFGGEPAPAAGKGKK